MRVTFFSKCLKFDISLKHAAKIWENNFAFLDNWISIRSSKFQILQREYLSLAVNVLRNTRKRLNITNKRDVLSHSLSLSLSLSLSQRYNVIWWKYSHGDFTSVWDPITCWHLNGAMKRGYLDICVTMPLTIRNFQNTQSTRVKLVSKCLEVDVDSRNWIKY